MFRKIHLLFAFALALPAASYGLVGGPWDNGDYSQILDETGIYQASLRFSNGQGFCQFGSNVDVANYIDLSLSAGGTAGGSSSSTARSPTYSYLNRSLIYYKGVTYLGTCYGTSDMVNNVIDGITNGNSDVSTTIQNNAGGGANQATQGTISSVTTLVTNGARSFTCNTAWSAKITSKKPVLKFKGKGQLTVLNPDGIAQVTPAVNALVATLGGLTPAQLSGASGSSFVNSIVNTINQISTGQVATPLTSTPTIGSLADAIPRTTSETTEKNADQVPLQVYGIRKFFLSRR